MPSFLSAPGYLPRDAVPDSLLLNPPPPPAGSSAEARDLAAAAAAVALHGTPRWDLATRDADLFGPNVADTYSCAAGLPIGPATTPKLNALMRRALLDLAGATSPTKRKYMRPRPFMANGKPLCTPEAEKVLRSDGSYPSGHSALGYGWGLILAEAIPDRAAQLVARGRAFGDSRRICNVHWLSDIEEGRVVASAVVARLNAEPAFQADLAAARAEVAALASKDPGRDCTAEAALLAL
jgi:acid phosphatase (class A)